MINEIRSLISHAGREWGDSMYYELLISFSEKLNMLLKENHMYGVELAKRIGVSQYAMNRWTNGYSLPRTDKFYLIAKVFNVSADWLLGLSDEKNRR